MAQPVDTGAAKPAKIRSPVAVAVLAFVTIFIYLYFWWYVVNREMADYGRVRGTNELGDSPGKSVLAITLGALVITPALYGYMQSGLNSAWRAVEAGARPS